MNKCTLVCNSNGTLFNDILKEYASQFESRYAEMKAVEGSKDQEGLNERYARLKKEGPKDEFKKHLRTYHQIQDELMTEMEMRKQPGLDDFLMYSKEEGMSVKIFANASPEYIDHVLEETRTKDQIDGVYTSLDENLGSRDGLAIDKNADTLGQIASENTNTLAYVSHKPKEAELGAAVYGIGVLITEDIDGPWELHQSEESNGFIVKVKDLSQVVNLVIATRDYLPEYQTWKMESQKWKKV